MSDLLDLERYFNTQSIYSDFEYFYIDFILAGLCAYVISLIYRHYGSAISNRKMFSSNFVILALTTMLIITVVKTSLALSLGLVGALSIVRFRSAIKEPEELTFLFLTMSVGLGFGSGQRVITLLGFLGIALYLVTRGFLRKSKSNEFNMLVSINSNNPSMVDLNKITSVLKKHSDLISLKRADLANDEAEFLIYARFLNVGKLNEAADSLRSLDKNLKMSFIEDKGLSS